MRHVPSHFSSPAAIVAAAVCLMLLAVPVAAQLQLVANPTVTGPIASSVPPGDPSHDYTFFATELDLESRGYVEEEFFIQGVATAYQISGLVAVPGLSSPYKTRIVVRRPVSAAQFNGTVLVEWYNVTNGADMENSWFQVHEHIMRSGTAWVGVSSQTTGVNRLKSFSASRYGSLTLSSDAYAFDVFSQAAQAVADPVGVDPLGGLKAEVLIAIGHSQSALLLSAYVNAVQPLTHRFDAFALHGDIGGPVRPDVLEVPVWKALSEYDVDGFFEAEARQPDVGLFRSWEVAGSSHVDLQTIAGRVHLRRRDMGSAGEDSMACTFMPFGSALPFHHAFGAGLLQLDRWVRTGIPMNSAPRLEMSPTNVLQRDSDGNARGGLRLSQIAVPIALHTGSNAGPEPCPRWGYSRRFTDARICELYPSRDDYLDHVVAAVGQSIQDGYLLEADAPEVLAAAGSVEAGCWPPQPTGSLTLSPSVLWPPNHKFVAITQILSVPEGVTVSGPIVTSNEPQSGLGSDEYGSDTSPDWVVSDGNLQLRAERISSGAGRVYTVTYTLTNSAGKTSHVNATVSVPRSQ